MNADMNADMKNKIIEAVDTSCEQIGRDAIIEYVYIAMVGDNGFVGTSKIVHKSNAEKYDDEYVGTILGSLAMKYLDTADLKYPPKKPINII